jgi:hypothetical protein
MIVAMHVLQRLRQVHPKLSVLFPHSRNALAAQQVLDADKCTAVKLLPLSPGHMPQVLEHISGSPVERARLPSIPISFISGLRITSHKDKGEVLWDVRNRFVACSLESIARRLTMGDTVRQFDVVVVDEATAHMKQLQSDGTMEDEGRTSVWRVTKQQLRKGGDLYVCRPERHIARVLYRDAVTKCVNVPLSCRRTRLHDAHC